MNSVSAIDPLVVRLLDFIRKREEGERVFVTHRLTTWIKNFLGQRVHRARKLAGLSVDVKLDGVRHAFGTCGIAAARDIKTLSVLTGHTGTNFSRMANFAVHTTRPARSFDVEAFDRGDLNPYREFNNDA